MRDKGSFRPSASIPIPPSAGVAASAQTLISGDEAARLLRIRDAAPALLEAAVRVRARAQGMRFDDDAAAALAALDAAIQTATGEA